MVKQGGMLVLLQVSGLSEGVIQPLKGGCGLYVGVHYNRVTAGLGFIACDSRHP